MAGGWRHKTFFLAFGLALAAITPGAAAVPDFSGVWVRAWPQAQLFEPPDAGPGPVTGDPVFPHIRGANSPWIADLTSPILKPGTRARLSELAERQKSGHAIFDNDTLCLPLGVLATLNLFDAMKMLQTPDRVVFLYARDHQMRVVRIGGAHRRNLVPSWYGNSIGHYEGDTLVVDTIGMNDKTLADRYGTPHSVSLHTVEHYRRKADGGLEATVTVEDPDSFTMAWSAKAAYRHDTAGKFEEIVCAENDHPLDGIEIPKAARPDF